MSTHEEDHAGSSHDGAAAHRLLGIHEGIETAHTVAEAVVNGGTQVSELAHESSLLWSAPSQLGAAEAATSYAGMFLSPLTALAGGYEMWNGLTHGGVEGALDVAQGAGDVVSGGAGMAALLGAGAAAPAAAAAAAFSGGMALGRFGDRAAADYDLFGEDEDGRGRTASDWMADKAVDADAWVADATGSKVLGDLAGGATVLGSSVVGGAGAVAGAAAAGIEAVDDVLVPTRSGAEEQSHQRALRERAMARVATVRNLQNRGLAAWRRTTAQESP